MSVARRIGTHDGSFHCDEVLACFLLKKLPEYVNAVIVRTRDQAILNTCDVVVDVGGIYDHKKKRYDHHQKTFTDSMKTLRPNKPWDIRLSSAGLVYHHYGEEILARVAEMSLEKNVVEKMFDYVYTHFVQEIDAIDNGVSMSSNGEPPYSIHTNISQRVGKLNPAWNEPSDLEKVQSRFEKAMKLVGGEFVETCHSFLNIWWPAREIIEKSVENRFETHSSGEVIEISFAPWRAHLFDIEKEHQIQGTIKFVIFSEKEAYRVVAVPLHPTGFALRRSLHPDWQGLREEPLKDLSGVSDIIFVHANGFIGGAKSRKGVLEMAEKSLNYWKDSTV